MTAVEDEPVHIAAQALALTIAHFRDILPDEDYAAVLPHFAALSDALPAQRTGEQDVPAEPLHRADPARIAGIVASA